MNPLDERNDKESAVIAKTLDAMWAKYLPDIRERVDVLDAAAEAAAAGTLTDELGDAAKSAAHKLAGTLGTFGLERGTEIARGLELRFARGGISVDEGEVIAKMACEIRELVNGRSA